MTLYKLFRTKRKLRRKDAQRTSTTDLDTSGILAQPFPPLVSRVKSPCDILDFVGYPRMQLQSQLTPPPPPSPITQYQQNPSPSTNALPLTIRNKTPTGSTVSVTPTVTVKMTEQSPPALIVHQLSSSTATGSPRDLSEVQMPAPKKAMPPTWRILNADRTEKTLVEDKPCNRDDAKQVIILHQQKINFELERQDWARREEQHRQLEQQMLRRIQENQTKIDQLSSAYSPDSNIPRKVPKSCRFKPRHSQPDLRASPQRPSSYTSSRDGDGDHSRDESGSESEYDMIEEKNQRSTHHTKRSNSITDRYCHYNQPINRHSMYYHNSRLMLTTPMNWTHYHHPSHYSDNDDDGYASEDDDSSIFEDTPLDNNILNKRYQHSPESSDDDDDDDDNDDDDRKKSLDDFGMNRYWHSSRSTPVYYTNRWPHPQRGYHHPTMGRLAYQRHMPLHLSNSAAATAAVKYNYHQRASSIHLTNERARKPLMRHYSYEDVPRNGFVPYHY